MIRSALLLLLVAGSPALASSVEPVLTVEIAEPLSLTDAEDLDAPRLSGAYSSLYRTEEDRRRHEARALGAAIRGSALGWAVAAGVSVVTFGVGLILVPPVVAFSIGYSLRSSYETPLGKVLLGAFAGAGAAGVITVSMGLLSAWPNRMPPEIAVGVSVPALLLFPALGGWIAAVSGQDQIERRRLLSLGPTPSGIHGERTGFGLTGRF